MSGMMTAEELAHEDQVVTDAAAAVTEVKPEVALVQRAEVLIVEVADLRITDQKSFDQAAGFLRKVVTLRREIEAYYKPEKQAQDLVKQRILDREKAALMHLIEPERVGKKLIVDYENEMRRLQAEQDRLERQRADEEHEANRQRQIEEARTNATREVLETLEGATPDEAEVLNKHADAIIEDAGREAARQMPTTVVYRSEDVIRKAPGVSTGTKYSVRVDDEMKIYQQIVDGTLPKSYAQVNIKGLDAKARLEKEEFKVDGCTLLANGTVTVRTKRQQ